MTTRFKRVVLRTGLGLLMVLALVVVIVAFQLGVVVKTAVNTLGPKATGVKVTLNQVKIRPLLGTALLRGLIVGNPPGFSDDNAIQLGELSVDVSLRSLLTDTIVIHSVVVNAPQIRVERHQRQVNLSVILHTIQKAAPASSPPSPPAPGTPRPTAPPPRPPAAPRKAKHVVVESLVIRDGHIELAAGIFGRTPLPLNLPEIRMSDIGKDKPMTGAEVGTAIMSEVVNKVLEAASHSTQSLSQTIKALQKEAKSGRLKQNANALGERMADNISKGADDSEAGIKKTGGDVADFLRRATAPRTPAPNTP